MILPENANQVVVENLPCLAHLMNALKIPAGWSFTSYCVSSDGARGRQVTVGLVWQEPLTTLNSNVFSLSPPPEEEEPQ